MYSVIIHTLTVWSQGKQLILFPKAEPRETKSTVSQGIGLKVICYIPVVRNFEAGNSY